jgi:hypothetical protein
MYFQSRFSTSASVAALIIPRSATQQDRLVDEFRTPILGR